MTRISLYASVLVLGGLSLAAGAAMAQQQRPPEPDFAGMAATLNVPEDALVSCLGDRPEKGQRPERPDASKVTNCLNSASYQVDTSSVDKSLSAAAPKHN